MGTIFRLSLGLAKAGGCRLFLPFCLFFLSPLLSFFLFWHVLSSLSPSASQQPASTIFGSLPPGAPASPAGEFSTPGFAAATEGTPLALLACVPGSHGRVTIGETAPGGPLLPGTVQTATATPSAFASKKPASWALNLAQGGGLPVRWGLETSGRSGGSQAAAAIFELSLRSYSEQVSRQRVCMLSWSPEF